MLKKYLISGATAGIGLGITRLLLEQGHTVIALGRDFTEIDSILKKYDDLVKLKVDLLNIKEIEPALNSIFDKLSKIDGFVHCAGIEETVPLRIYSSDLINNIFSVNVFSAIEILRIISQKKISNDESSFVFLSSVMGILGQAGKSGYCSSKSAIYGFVRSAALELSKRRIRVNAVSPGLVKTPMMYRMFEVLPEESRQTLIKMHPLGFGSIEDVTSLISFLLSDKSKWITGQNLIIDGGYSIH